MCGRRGLEDDRSIAAIRLFWIGYKVSFFELDTVWPRAYGYFGVVGHFLFLLTHLSRFSFIHPFAR